MCQILVFNAINTIVTDMECNISNYYINIISLRQNKCQKDGGFFACGSQLFFFTSPLFVLQFNFDRAIFEGVIVPF